MAALPIMCDFPPMKIEVSVLVYPGFELLDATGPVSVFNTANYILGQRAKSAAYGITMVSPTGRLVRSSSGIGVDTQLQWCESVRLRLRGDFRACFASVDRWSPRSVALERMSSVGGRVSPGARRRRRHLRRGRKRVDFRRGIDLNRHGAGHGCPRHRRRARKRRCKTPSTLRETAGQPVTVQCISVHCFARSEQRKTRSMT
jgi:hypothetical protein